ncbi:MAG: hypothetical protein AAF548_12785 [Actinomycetota bacterium]
MFEQFVPDGPLHPGAAIAGVLAGAVVVLVCRRRPALCGPAAVVGAAIAAGWGYGDLVIDGYADRPDTRNVALASVAVVVLGVLRPHRLTDAAPTALGALVGVWAVVPDTELAVLGLGVVAIVWLGSLISPEASTLRRSTGCLVLIPLVAAVAGSVGRPARFEPALAVAALGMALAVTGLAFLRRLREGQRAGMPTTVDPGSTSSTTTAPAPTTAP